MKNLESKAKILIILPPFWDPQIPPLGIACLKSYLQKKGYDITGTDFNVKQEFRNFHDEYFNILKENIPENYRGNIYNIGNQVFRNHLMAFQNKTDQNQYEELVNSLIYNTFYFNLKSTACSDLDNVLGKFYSHLESYFINLFKQENPDVLGFTVYGDTLPAAVFCFKLAKKINPAILNVMGGGIFSDQLALGSPELDIFIEKTGNFIDKYVIGEGEELFFRALDKSNAKKVFSIANEKNLPIEIEQLGIPEFSDFNLEYYPHMAHFGARSCPFQCNFCSETVNWGKYRKKDIKKTVEEFRNLYEKYNYQLFLLTDSTLNPIATPLSNELINQNVPVYWDGFLRADKHVCDIENTILWRQGGFYRAKLGLESGSQRLLDLMNKKTTIQQYEEALKSLSFAGIKTTTFWLFGFPGETDDDFNQTLEFVEKQKDYIYEADCNAFNYYLSGQVNSDEWHKNKRAKLLYPDWAREMLITQTYYLDDYPSREIAYKRLNIFIEHCRKIGIPNPYSLNDINKADVRWENLHKNAVPALVKFKDSNRIDECRSVKKYSFANLNISQNNFEFDF